jgi:ketosteroid isomerase-like protein
MNMIKRVVIGLCGSLSLAIAAAQPPSATEDTVKELLALQHQWAAARVKRDVAFLESFYAKEFRITSMDGSVVSRAVDIGVFASGEMKPESVTDENMEVLTYDDVAVVTGLEKVRGTYKGVFGNFALRFTNVFVQRDGRWQLVTHHSTEVRGR